MTKTEFFNFYFSELTRMRIPYAVLHSYREFPGVISSDVDYCVPHEHLRTLPGLQRQIVSGTPWRLVQVFVQHITSVCSIFYNTEDSREWIWLDVCSHYVEDGRDFLTASQLLDGRRQHGSFWIPSAASEFCYVVAKAIGKRKPLALVQPRLAELHAQDPNTVDAIFTKTFPEAGFNAPALLKASETDWHAPAERIRSSRRYTFRQRLLDLGRQARRAWHPTGLCLAFLGPDGAGKSTVLAASLARLSPAFRSTKTCHFRPHILDKSDGNAVSSPHSSPPRGPGATVLKLAYYLADAWIGQVWLIAAKVRSTLIIFDRTLEDMCIDPTRYRLGVPGGVIRFVSRVAPRADLTFVLHAEPATIHARKAELPIKEISRQIDFIRGEGCERPHWILVSAETPIDAIVETISQEALRLLANRTASNYAPVKK